MAQTTGPTAILSTSPFRPISPLTVLPADIGLIVADPYEGTVLRPAPAHPALRPPPAFDDAAFRSFGGGAAHVGDRLAGLVPGERER